MVKSFYIYVLILLGGAHNTLQCGGAGNFVDIAKNIFTPEGVEREEQLTSLKEEYATLEQTVKRDIESIQFIIDQLNKDIASYKNELAKATGPQAEFLNKITNLANEKSQTLLNIQFAKKNILSSLEQQIKVLKDYKKDPDFKSLSLEPRSFYTYEFVLDYIKRTFDQEDRVKLLKSQKSDTTSELENKKKKLAQAVKEYQEKLKEQEEFATKSNGQKALSEAVIKNQGKVLDMEVELDEYEKQLAELKVEAATRKLSLLNTQFFYEQEKLKVLKDNVSRSKASMRISESDLKEAQNQLEAVKQQTLINKDKLYQEIKNLTAKKEQYKTELSKLQEQYRFDEAQGGEINFWSVKADTIENFVAQAQLGLKKIQILYLGRKVDFINSQIQKEDLEVLRKTVNLNMFEAWSKLGKSEQLADNEKLSLLIKNIRDLEAEAKRDFAMFQDRRAASTNLLNVQNKEMLNLKDFIEKLKSERNQLFKDNSQTYNQTLSRLNAAEKTVTQQVDLSGKLIDIYSQMIGSLHDIIQELSTVANELETKNIWKRSEYAISWRGVKNIGPDVGKFIDGVRQLTRAYFAHLKWSNLKQSFDTIFHSPSAIILILLLMIIIIMVYILLKIYLPRIRDYGISLISENSIYSFFLSSSSLLISYLYEHLLGLYVWVVFFAAVYFEYIVNTWPKVMFYLISIPYLMYYATRLIQYVAWWNNRHDYQLFSKHFERRFITLTSVLAYSSIVIFFFRQAFILATVHDSELPSLLKAVYLIILSGLVIFWIGKEDILALLDRKGPFWQWFSGGIDRYYYLILTTLIILMVISHPYVGGYGNLIYYILWGVIGSTLLMCFLYYIHTRIKRASENIFFSTDEEEVKRERFAYAKTWYGLYVIGLFLLFIIVGGLIALRLWGITITWPDIYNFIHFPIFSTGLDKSTGQPIYFTPMRFLIVALFVLAGFLSAIAFNRFVLQRIFDILPVDTGVQNTVMSITRYFIILLAIFLGFQWAGLGTLLIAISIAIGGITYVLKEPFGDFISYFIILVQRPIQIGDYIMLEPEIQGVVRKITPRSVILRRKDSYSIIVPNSMILSRPINNWNYARNFVAIDDIYFTISFTDNPEFVRTIIQKVLDGNLDVLKTPAPIIRLNELGESGFIFMVRCFISNMNILRRFDIASDIRFALIKSLREQNIKIAVPTRLIINPLNGQQI